MPSVWMRSKMSDIGATFSIPDIWPTFYFLISTFYFLFASSSHFSFQLSVFQLLQKTGLSPLQFVTRASFLLSSCPPERIRASLPPRRRRHANGISECFVIDTITS